MAAPLTSPLIAPISISRNPNDAVDRVGRIKDALARSNTTEHFVRAMQEIVNDPATGASLVEWRENCRNSLRFGIELPLRIAAAS